MASERLGVARGVMKGRLPKGHVMGLPPCRLLPPMLPLLRYGPAALILAGAALRSGAVDARLLHVLLPRHSTWPMQVRDPRGMRHRMGLLPLATCLRFRCTTWWEVRCSEMEERRGRVVRGSLLYCRAGGRCCSKVLESGRLDSCAQRSALQRADETAVRHGVLVAGGDVVGGHGRRACCVQTFPAF